MSLEIATRNVELSDATDLTALLIERKYDAVPNQNEHNLERLAWWEEHGNKLHRTEIQTALDNPSVYFLRVATIGAEVVGYLKANNQLAAPQIEGGPFTHASGLMVAKRYDSQGVGRALTNDFCKWAIPLEQDVYVEVTVGNHHARDIYESHGCEYAKSVPGTAQTPPLDILVLPFQKLVQLADCHEL